VEAEWPELSELLPQTGIARLLTKVLRCNEFSIEATALIPGCHPFVTGDTAPSFLTIELGAQAAACMEVLNRRKSGTRYEGAVLGSLVRVREATVYQDTLPIGKPILIRAKLQATAQPLAIYRVAAVIDEVVFCEAIISTRIGPVAD
jgi:predicted hotdog family 3-hydroxylacyl-ACP dehydratase